MIREVEYHEVKLSFIVTERDAARATGKIAKQDVRSELASLLYTAIRSHYAGCLDAEEVIIEVDGRMELGA